jgi:hypothetical protein
MSTHRLGHVSRSSTPVLRRRLTVLNITALQQASFSTRRRLTLIQGPDNVQIIEPQSQSGGIEFDHRQRQRPTRARGAHQAFHPSEVGKLVKA